MSKHLWEVDHPYYCEETNFYERGCAHQHKSWADFVTGFATDMDLNLVFRFDWKEDEETPFNGDLYYRNGRLTLFFMMQRKGAYCSHTIEVCRADEPTVLEWLQPRFEHMLKLWEPFTTPPVQFGGAE
jgi:hypothetical protein